MSCKTEMSGDCCEHSESESRGGRSTGAILACGTVSQSRTRTYEELENVYTPTPETMGVPVMDVGQKSLLYGYAGLGCGACISTHVQVAGCDVLQRCGK